MRRPLFGAAGPWLVRVLCGWELVALCAPRSGVPTVSQVVARRHWVGWVLIGALAQHWFLERPADSLPSITGG